MYFAFQFTTFSAILFVTSPKTFAEIKGDCGLDVLCDSSIFLIIIILVSCSESIVEITGGSGPVVLCNSGVFLLMFIIFCTNVHCGDSCTKLGKTSWVALVPNSSSNEDIVQWLTGLLRFLHQAGQYLLSFPDSRVKELSETSVPHEQDLSSFQAFYSYSVENDKVEMNTTQSIDFDIQVWPCRDDKRIRTKMTLHESKSLQLPVPPLEDEWSPIDPIIAGDGMMRAWRDKSGL